MAARLVRPHISQLSHVRFRFSSSPSFLQEILLPRQTALPQVRQVQATARFSSTSMAGAAHTTDIVPGQTRVGWIGTGVMGQAMAGHILASGFQVSVYNRTRSKTDELVSKGAKYAESPLAVAQQSDVVFTIVGYPTDVREVVLGDKGILHGLKPGGIFVDMTTSEPSLAREIFASAQEKSVDAVDAPVSGGDKGAKTGSLSIMAGGKEETVKKLEPLFKVMGSCTYLGPAGSGQSCKLANQVTIATTMIGLVEGLIYAYKAGLDVSVFLQAIRGGAAGSKSLDLYADRIQGRDFAPGFYVNHFVKDLGIALDECKDMGLALPGLALAQQLYVALKSHGDGSLGTQALILSLERLNNIKRTFLSDRVEENFLEVVMSQPGLLATDFIPRILMPLAAQHGWAEEEFREADSQQPTVIPTFRSRQNHL